MSEQPVAIKAMSRTECAEALRDIARVITQFEMHDESDILWRSADLLDAVGREREEHEVAPDAPGCAGSIEVSFTVEVDDSIDHESPCQCTLRPAEINAVLAMREVENVTDEEAGRILAGRDEDHYGGGYGDVRGNLVIIDTYFDMPQIPRVAAVLNVLAMRAASKEAT